jgi:WS/DGAT/MGAT family acyltransferase
MARLTALDASFLRVETPTAHMHVGWLAPLELPPGAERLDAAALIDQIASRLHLAPRFRQRLAGVPLGLAEAAWVDDADFDVRRHIRIVEPAEPVASGELRALTDRFMSKQLARDRPLWEILIVPRVRGARAAVLGKVHHAMVDGVAAVELGMVLFDLSPRAERPEPVDWQPEAAAGAMRIAADAVADGAVEQFRSLRRAAAAGFSPRRTLRVADTMRRAAFSMAEDAIQRAPDSYLNVPIGPRRTLATYTCPLERLLHLKQTAGVTLNDIVLAASAGALRRLAVERREDPHDLRVMVPVSVRADEDAPDSGNRITFGFVELPVAARTASARLAAIREQTEELKSSGRIGGSDLLLRSTGLLPGALKGSLARFAASPRLYNLTISNVPGPRVPLYAAGARVTAIYPVIPIPDRHALAIGVLTYDGGVHFAGYADRDALPGLRLSGVVSNALTELEISLGGRPRVQRRLRNPVHPAKVADGGSGARSSGGARARTSA